MKSIVKIVAFMLLSITAFNLHAEGPKDATPPAWINGSDDCRLSNTYIKTGIGFGSTEAKAREAAINQVLSDRASQIGIVVNSDGSTVDREQNRINTKSRELDHWVERDGTNGYKYYILMEVKSNLREPFSSARVTNKWGFSPTVFVPGMAQIRKGSTGKGVGFISAEAVCVGGIIVSECMRSSYNSKINTTHNAQTIKNYSDKANNCATMRNVCIGAAAAVYVWNVIDGIVAKGKTHVVIDDKPVALTPYFDTQSVGLAMTLNF